MGDSNLRSESDTLKRGGESMNRGGEHSLSHSCWIFTHTLNKCLFGSCEGLTKISFVLLYSVTSLFCKSFFGTYSQNYTSYRCLGNLTATFCCHRRGLSNVGHMVQHRLIYNTRVSVTCKHTSVSICCKIHSLHRKLLS